MSNKEVSVERRTPVYRPWKALVAVTAERSGIPADIVERSLVFFFDAVTESLLAMVQRYDPDAFRHEPLVIPGFGCMGVFEMPGRTMRAYAKNFKGKYGDDLISIPKRFRMRFKVSRRIREMLNEGMEPAIRLPAKKEE